jgi:hypothetical protein
MRNLYRLILIVKVDFFSYNESRLIFFLYIEVTENSHTKIEEIGVRTPTMTSKLAVSGFLSVGFVD